MDKLAIRKSKVNWLEIINMALNREGWGKTYNIYTYNNVTVRATLDEYNFRHHRGTFYVEILYQHDDIACRRTTWVNYQTENFDVVDFARYMKRRIKSLLKDIQEQTTKNVAEMKYMDLKTSRYDIREKDYIEQGFANQYNSIMYMDEEYQEEMLYTLSETVANKMNIHYKEAVDKFCETLIPMPNIVALEDAIQLELEKEKEELDNE